MDVFVARQPIFSRFRQVFGYELLFRSSLNNAFEHRDADQATVKVMTDTFFLLGIESITRGKPAFINFTRDTLARAYHSLFPKELLIIEISETVKPDDEVLAICQSLKEAGYQVGLDNFAPGPGTNPLLSLADFVKVDFQTVGPAERRAVAQALLPRGLSLVGTKIETDEEFAEAVELGFEYVQGYFFCKPVVIAGGDVPMSKLSHVRLLQETSRRDPDLERIEDIIKREVALSYKLLRYINSVSFGLRFRIDSVRRALMMLGQQGTRKWASMVVVSNIGSDTPSELVVSAVIRAKFCELIAQASRLRDRQHDLFLLGLFSLMDVMIGRPLPAILADLPVAEDVKKALEGEDNDLRSVYDLVLAYERGDWTPVARLARDIGLELAALPSLYCTAVEWGDSAGQLDEAS
jgi:EAL and modified HD-GYP domain-containing signal transduction protein